MLPPNPNQMIPDIFSKVGAWRHHAAIAIVTGAGLSGLHAQDPEPDFTFDFNTDPSDQIDIITNNPGSTEWRASGGVDDTGYLSLTDATNGTRAAIIFDDPTGGKPIEGLNFSVDCRIGGGTDQPADGFSVNIVRPSDPLLQGAGGVGYAASPTNEADLPEEGSQTGLGIGFDAWYSGGTDVIGFSVRVDGELVTQVPAPTLNGEADDIESLQTGPLNVDDPLSELTWQPFEVDLTPAGELTISWKGEVIVDALPVNYFPGPGQIVFGARTGDANQHHHFDNLSLTILAAAKAVVSGLEFSREEVKFQITDGEDSAVADGSIALTLNGEEVNATITKEGQITSILYTPETPFETASILTYELTAMDTLGNDVGRSGTIELPVPYFPIDPLPGAEPAAGQFGVRYLWGGTGDFEQINDAREAIAAIQAVANGTWEGEFFDTLSPVINYTGGGIFADDLQYPEEVTSSDLWTAEDFVQYARGYLRITQPGDYTFGVHSDDGFGLRVHGASFVSFDTGASGEIDPGDPSTLFHNTPTGDANTRGVLRVTEAGTYLVEFFWYERGGGDNGEFYVSKGAIEGGDADPAASWTLVGESESFLNFPVPGVDENGWDIIASAPGGDEINDLASALLDIEATGVAVNVDAFNIGNNGATGSLPGDIAIPGDTGGDDDDFAVSGTAKLVIPQDGTYMIGFQSDDGMEVRIPGQEFIEIVENATGEAVLEGDTIRCDCLTGNSRTVATIALTAGTYDIEALFFERGGGAYGEVFGAGEGASGMFILTRNGAGIRSVEPALALVEPPAPQLDIISFESDADQVSIDFLALDVSAPHEMETSADLIEWTALETTVSVVDGAQLRAEVARDDAAAAYYRVVQLPPPPILGSTFEDGADGWTVDAGVWESGMPAEGTITAIEGTNVFATSLQDGYTDNANSGLRSPIIDLTGVSNPRLRFQYFQEMGEDEGVRLDFLDADGTPLFNSDIIFTGSSGGWVEFNRPIPTEARDQEIFVEFRLLTDSDAGNNGFGFALDDVLISGN